MSDIPIKKSRGKKYIGGASPIVPSYVVGEAPPPNNPPGSYNSVVHNNTTLKQGGDGTNYYHLGQTDYDKLQDVFTVSEWELSTPAGTKRWVDIAFGNGIYVAISNNGDANRVMTSTDGISWTERVAFAESWSGVTYGLGLFVAVASGTSANKVMTSPDGITWTLRSTLLPSSAQLADIAFSGSLFVAVCRGTLGTDFVITSPDGITWTNRTGINKTWQQITFGAGLFVAISNSGFGTDQIMSSPDGITWTIRNATINDFWQGISFGNSVFVILSTNGRINYSFDGITWLLSSPPENISSGAIGFGNGKFIILGSSPDEEKSLESTNGITWQSKAVPFNSKSWSSLVYGNEFVAVGFDTTTFFGTSMYKSIPDYELLHSSLNLDDGRNPHQTRYEDLLGTPPRFPYVIKTSAYTITTDDYYVEASSGTFTFTLPSAIGVAGQVFVINNSGVGTITVLPILSQTINNETEQFLSQYDSIKIVSNGTNWKIV